MNTRPAAAADPGRVPHRRGRLQPRARPAVPLERARRRDHGPGGGLMADGNGKLIQLTAKDFKSDQEVRWCPGCGDYAILNAVQGFMPELGIPKERIVFVSGHRLRGPVPVLHGDVRRALDPRPRAGDRDGARDGPLGPVRVGDRRRRRHALDRRQSSDPCAAAQRQPDDPHAQQPDLRAHEGPVLADERARQGDEVDAHGLGRPALQPAVGRDRRRGDVRRARDRHRQEGAVRGAPRRGRRTAARRSSRCSRTATSTTTARSTSCASRRRTAST